MNAKYQFLIFKLHESSQNHVAVCVRVCVCDGHDHLCTCVYISSYVHTYHKNVYMIHTYTHKEANWLHSQHHMYAWCMLMLKCMSLLEHRWTVKCLSVYVCINLHICMNTYLLKQNTLEFIRPEIERQLIQAFCDTKGCWLRRFSIQLWRFWEDQNLHFILSNTVNNLFSFRAW